MKIIVPDTDSTYAAIFLGGKATFAVLFGSNPNVLNEILHFESKVKLWKAQCTTEFTKSPEIIKINKRKERKINIVILCRAHSTD